MVETQSTMLPLGTRAPNFHVPDVTSDAIISLSTFAPKKALLVMFICAHCPYVRHVKQEIANIGKDYENSDLGIVAINSNDRVSHPDDAPEYLKAMAKELHFSFPFCFDETQDVAKAYTAACTPDFFLFNKDRILVYRGQLDESRPGNDKPVNGKDLRAAIESVLHDLPVDHLQKPSMGCNIKWKQGNAPSYFG